MMFTDEEKNKNFLEFFTAKGRPPKKRRICDSSAKKTRTTNKEKISTLSVRHGGCEERTLRSLRKECFIDKSKRFTAEFAKKNRGRKENKE